MRLEICEGDGYLYKDGKPKNIIVIVDGKRMIVPAKAKLSELVEIVNNLKVTAPAISGFPQISDDPITLTDEKNSPVVNGISRNDIVKCIKAHKREDELSLVVGKEYRVIDIYRKNGVVEGYDIMDDSAGDRMRIGVLPDEIEFVRKSPSKQKKQAQFEAIRKCPGCNEDVVLVLDNEIYRGICDNCKNLIEVSRETIAPKAA